MLLGFSMIHGAAIILWVCNLLVIFAEAVQILSFDLYNRSTKTEIRIRNENASGRQPKILRLKNKVRKGLGMKSTCDSDIKTLVFNISTKLHFGKCLRLFHMLDILMRAGNVVVADFLTVLTGMGIIIGTWGGFVMIIGYDELPLLLYICGSIVFPIALILTFVLISLASVPHKNGRLFKVHWKCEVKLKIDRMQLKACPSIGYAYGPIRMVKKHTALEIVNVMFNLVASLSLMRTKY